MSTIEFTETDLQQLKQEIHQEVLEGHCLVKERAVPGSGVHDDPETAQRDHRASVN